MRSDAPVAETVRAEIIAICRAYRGKENFPGREIFFSASRLETVGAVRCSGRKAFPGPILDVPSRDIQIQRPTSRPHR